MGYRGNCSAEYIASGVCAIVDCGEVRGSRSDCRGENQRAMVLALPLQSDLCPLTSDLHYNSIMLPALMGLTSAAAASMAGYQSMAPTGQWFGPTFAGGVRGRKQIALTYDDGPNDPHTLKLLEVLAKHNVRATFFMIGRYVQQRPDIARDVARLSALCQKQTLEHANE